ncbi:hypothetical protein SLEP1_g5522 [Rubroshorea leprosula]|uniref:Uncharacterized protein n=1 Tax=Rubroshorea leprosula TaxID=152421 RepID=A0AAV5I2U6_9ROSI|nr:hypothetical protein SLEP1_g5522 [Rubroshorea leprosula]
MSSVLIQTQTQHTRTPASHNHSYQQKHSINFKDFPFNGRFCILSLTLLRHLLLLSFILSVIFLLRFACVIVGMRWAFYRVAVASQVFLFLWYQSPSLNKSCREEFEA